MAQTRLDRLLPEYNPRLIIDVDLMGPEDMGSDAETEEERECSKKHEDSTI
jgi:hypothetical protein